MRRAGRLLPQPTLRTRTTLLATVVTGLVLVLGALALLATLRAGLTQGADDLARSRARDLLALAQSGNLPDRLPRAGDETVAQVVTADGRTVLAATANIIGQPPIADFRATDGFTLRTVQAPDDAEIETYRLWTADGTSAQGPVRVYVGTTLESVQEATRTLRRSLLVGVPIILLALAAGTWWVLGGALRRIDRIRAEVDDITQDRLDRRVSESDTDDEVGRLAATMNRMLRRLEVSTQRQRDFVADVSHDLQSPLASQRAQLEVVLATDAPAGWKAGSPGSGDVGRELLATTAEMERLVGDLLVLAAIDDDAPAAEPSLVDLDVIVLEEVARVSPLSRITLETGGVSAAPVRAPDGDLRRIVRNLLDNAVAHAESRVEVRVSSATGAAVLDVLDDGPGVPEADRERIFDRFHRGDPARVRDRGDTRHGSGLGLAIARSLTERTGGRLDLVDPAAAHFRLWLPSGD